MGNKLSCSCAPLIKKAYRYEDTPWQNSRRRDGHLLRLWAEVFYVSGSSGAVKWQQVSEDLVPVNITCIQDSPECVFHITAYNSQVEKILDVRLVQPGTRLGQASECFVYWKDPATGDTWGLNFTSPLDAKQFRECCSPAFKFSRKASSSYSLKLEPPKNQKPVKGGTGAKRKPQSTPSSPSRSRELQCTCMTAENLHRARNGRVRYTGAATLPRSQLRRTNAPTPTEKSSGPGSSSGGSGRPSANQARAHYASRKEQAKSVDYGDRKAASDVEDLKPSSRSKSTDNVFTQSNDLAALNLDSNTLKRMLNPLPATAHSSPEMRKARRIAQLIKNNAAAASGLRRSESSLRRSDSLGMSSARRRSLERSVCLDLTDQSPPSDHFLYDNFCYATTPSSSNSDVPYPSSDEGQRNGRSATGRLLMEYEMHLRNALARGLDAESYSLHTFEALLSQSMENVAALMRDVHVELEAIKREERAIIRSQRSTDDESFVLPLSGPLKSNTLPVPSFSRRLTPSLSAGSSLLGSSLESGPSMIQQASLESTDSRIYLTSSEMSDDDHLSLTAAVSDEDDPDGQFRSRSESGAAAFNCTGALRKAGFLSVKKWLLRKRQAVELARKRGWKGYWVCLKGTTLLFYPCDNRDGRSIDSTPKHLIIVDGSIMQPIPEHPKRDYIFCLSTAFGDAYLFQAPCQVELENWIHSIHSACAAAFARHRGKTGTLHLLQEEIMRLDKDLESDYKLKHMAELQLTVVADVDSQQAITQQILEWEENIERIHCEQFRLRCYMASLQNSELPNPKSLLAHVSKNTKSILNQLGVFTVSSLHAYVSARSPSLLTNLLAGRGATKRRPRGILSRSNSGSTLPSARSQWRSNRDFRRSLSVSTTSSCSVDGPPALGERTIKVTLPENQQAAVVIHDHMTVEELLWSSCAKRQLSPNDHFLRIRRKKEFEEYYVPPRNELVDNLTYDETIEICSKVLYQVELSRGNLDHLFGFSVEAELVENSEHQDELCVYVSRVEESSQAYQQGLMKGDEIMVINGAIVSDLDMMYIESVLQEELSLCMMMRSCRTEPPDLTNAVRTTDDYIESLVCPPPPSDSTITDEMIGKLIVPSPLWGSQERHSPDTSGRPTPSPVPPQDALSADQIESLLKVIEDSCKKTAEQVTEICRVPLERRRSSVGSQSSVQTNRQLSEAEKLRKVIMELVDTERTYVKHLNNLLEHYLEPMKRETFLSTAEINALFGNIQEIVQFQRVFLQSLEEAISAEPDFHKFEHTAQFKNVLFALGNSFLYYADQFKLYSSFCASHSKAQKVLHPGEGNLALAEFLQARNPRGQHAFSLESYLIKPIQRILKYPLLLQQLKQLTDPNTEQHHHLAEALKGMERVAEHINEMQRIHEEYGAIFDHLQRQHLKVSKQSLDLTPGELLYYGGVDWINIPEFLGKIKKGLELHAMCFVFKGAVVFLCKERLRQKKKLMGSSAKNNGAEVEIIRYQVLIPVTEVQVRSSTLKDTDDQFVWELIHLKSQLQRRSEKVYQLANRSADSRNNFLRTIRQIIRESVRNMTVPVTKQLPNRERVKRVETAETLSRTLSGKRKGGAHRHSAGVYNQEATEDLSGSAKDLRRSPYESEKSDKSDKSSVKSEKSARSAKPHLGTPKALSLSTTSTLSSSSTGSSSAKLIQSSNPPTNYQPQLSEAGSPVWKLRENSFDTKSATMPAPSKSVKDGKQYFVYEDYGSSMYLPPGPSRQSEC